MIALLLAALQQIPASGGEDALWERARARSAAGEHFEAYHAYREFVLRYPQSPRASEAKRLEMASGLELAKTGHAPSTLGLRLFSSSATGVEYLRDSLRRYPREEFAADFTQKLGMFYYRKGEWDASALEFQTVLDQYAESPESVLALYMLALTAEQRFDGVERDLKPVKEARRLHERFLEEADKMRRLPDPAPRWVDELVPAVKARLARIYGLLLEKHLRTAVYYDWKDFPRASAVYYRTILKDEASYRRVLPDPRDYPVHEAVLQARARLAEDAGK
ncbi:MAG TPA: outer membrane protein assembly factor BamD [Planctomycetota bacterium]